MKWIKGVIFAMLAAIGGWALFQLAWFLIATPLEALGLVNPIWKYIAIIFIVAVLMVIIWGTGVKKAISNMVK